ncbi:MAG: 2-oxo acid dehydrogenase subunit E2 [Alphaproteobacteria bacterium]|nr:2-oxo acid dehydrogenase subunit E2 [Alphaproteobacteria bacterium]
MSNIALVRKTDLSSFRMIAIGTWRTTKDPSVYGAIELEMDETLRYLEALRAATGKRVTVTHLMAKAMGIVLSEMPDANAILRFNRIYLRQSVDVFFQVAMKDPVTGQIDLSGLTIREADRKSMPEIVDEFERVAAKVRAGKDEEKERTRTTFKSLPGFLVGPLLDAISLLIYTLNLDLSFLGLPKDPFGSAMVTNVGSLGLEEAYVPLVPYSKVPLLVAVGALKRTVAVREGDVIEPVTVMRLFATFDHRILDGAHAAKMAGTLHRIFADPWTAFGGVERPVAVTA